jgi:hypothetical protein
MIAQVERAWSEVETLRAQVKIGESVKIEINNRDIENTRKINELKEALEKKDYQHQHA